MVWASRRTAIYTNFNKILDDDGYRRLPSGDVPVEGDLVVYSSGSHHLHVGVIMSFESLVSGSTRRVPLVLSKWSDSHGEYLHREGDHPFQGLDAQIEYWTDRP